MFQFIYLMNGSIVLFVLQIGMRHISPDWLIKLYWNILGHFMWTAISYKIVQDTFKKKFHEIYFSKPNEVLDNLFNVHEQEWLKCTCCRAVIEVTCFFSPFICIKRIKTNIEGKGNDVPVGFLFIETHIVLRIDWLWILFWTNEYSSQNNITSNS